MIYVNQFINLLKKEEEKKTNRKLFNKYAANTPHVTWVAPSNSCDIDKSTLNYAYLPRRVIKVL